jgi:hypothetical protein
LPAPASGSVNLGRVNNLGGVNLGGVNLGRVNYFIRISNLGGISFLGGNIFNSSIWLQIGPNYVFRKSKKVCINGFNWYVRVAYRY